ncbi:hypothetical protein M9H77_08219 [Catharanthus roseus]|uniref:Uncharacterized protein n=1 Tax=Catharanthus roseus TaxID=4058 RepID=A0ACC0BX51_CATRO|nr:hypothetical protein M9H77_08219 [Catharanthus roseus]
MVRLGACRGDDYLGPVIDRTGRVEDRVVTASSYISSTSAPIGPGMYYDPGAPGTRPPTTSYHPYTPLRYVPYGYSQPPQTSYDLYAHAPSLPIRMPSLDPAQYFSNTQIPLNEFFEQLAGSVPVDSSYSSADYGATNSGNPSSDAGLGRDSGTFWSEEAVRIGSLCIRSGENDEDERENDVATVVVMMTSLFLWLRPHCPAIGLLRVRGKG